MIARGPESVAGATGSIVPLEMKEVIAAGSPPPNLPDHLRRPGPAP